MLSYLNVAYFLQTIQLANDLLNTFDRYGGAIGTATAAIAQELDPEFLKDLFNTLVMRTDVAVKFLHHYSQVFERKLLPEEYLTLKHDADELIVKCRDSIRFMEIHRLGLTDLKFLVKTLVESYSKGKSISISELKGRCCKTVCKTGLNMFNFENRLDISENSLKYKTLFHDKNSVYRVLKDTYKVRFEDIFPNVQDNKQEGI